MPYSDPDKQRAYQSMNARRWYDNLSDEARHTRRMFSELMQLAFPEKSVGYTRKWQISNPEHNKAMKQQWSKSNPHLVCAYSAKRRALKRRSSIGNRILISRIYSRCRNLRQWFDVVVDHIVPLAKGGTHTHKNLQIIYRTDNEKKHISLNYKPKVVFT